MLFCNRILTKYTLNVFYAFLSRESDMFEINERLTRQSINYITCVDTKEMRFVVPSKLLYKKHTRDVDFQIEIKGQG